MNDEIKIGYARGINIDPIVLDINEQRIKTLSEQTDKLTKELRTRIYAEAKLVEAIEKAIEEFKNDVQKK